MELQLKVIKIRPSASSPWDLKVRISNLAITNNKSIILIFLVHEIFLWSNAIFVLPIKNRGKVDRNDSGLILSKSIWWQAYIFQ